MPVQMLPSVASLLFGLLHVVLREAPLAYPVIMVPKGQVELSRDAQSPPDQLPHQIFSKGAYSGGSPSGEERARFLQVLRNICRLLAPPPASCSAQGGAPAGQQDLRAWEEEEDIRLEFSCRGGGWRTALGQPLELHPCPQRCQRVSSAKAAHSPALLATQGAPQPEQSQSLEWALRKAALPQPLPA